MNRRSVIKNLALLVGGIALVPSCIQPGKGNKVQLKNISLEEGDQNLISEICESLIPKTHTPGAKDLNLPSFVLKMIDDGYTKKDQQAFLKGLKDFNGRVENQFHKEFILLTKQQKETFLLGIEGEIKKLNDQLVGTIKISNTDKGAKNKGVEPVQKFYQIIKNETLFGYTTSEYFMTKEIVYELVPGRYKVHFPINQKKIA